PTPAASPAFALQQKPVALQTPLWLNWQAPAQAPAASTLRSALQDAAGHWSVPAEPRLTAPGFPPARQPSCAPGHEGFPGFARPGQSPHQVRSTGPEAG